MISRIEGVLIGVETNRVTLVGISESSAGKAGDGAQDPQGGRAQGTRLTSGAEASD